MRDWQVGDPPDLGDNVGVPDIPYMGYIKDEPEETSSYSNRTFEEKLDDICDRMLVDQFRIDEVKRELTLLLRAKGAYLSDVSIDIGSATFIITRENKYFKTEDIFYFINDYYNPDRVFEDSVTRHFYDGLANDSKFQNVIKETGMKFLRFSGGYKSTYHRYKDKFELLDAYDVRAHFDYDEERTIMYKIDFSDMSLIDDDYIKFYK